MNPDLPGPPHDPLPVQDGLLPGPSHRPLAIAGLYPLRSDAYDRGLVLSAMGVPYWIIHRPENDDFALCVAPAHLGAVAAELARFEAERIAQPPPPPEPPPVPHSSLSLYVCAWVLCGLFAVQFHDPAWWEDRGVASSRAIMAGQWWRAVTALTLHADLSHLAANLATGLIYAAFLLPILGSGWTWLFILIGGALGNLANAWGWRTVEHLSIGASTSVFAAVGILVAAQCTQQTLALRAVKLREFLLPVGAGLALLAYLGGAGDAQVDSTAHLFGFIAGIPLGILGAGLRLGQRTPRLVQTLLAAAALALIALAWLLAANSKG